MTLSDYLRANPDHDPGQVQDRFAVTPAEYLWQLRLVHPERCPWANDVGRLAMERVLMTYEKHNFLQTYRLNPNVTVRNVRHILRQAGVMELARRMPKPRQQCLHQRILKLYNQGVSRVCIRVVLRTSFRQIDQVLGPKMRLVSMLRADPDMTANDIAVHFGIALSTARTWYERAMTTINRGVSSTSRKAIGAGMGATKSPQYTQEQEVA